MVTEFRGPNRFLSNFEGPAVRFEGLLYPTVEHAFQAGKTLDKGIRISLCQSSVTPGEAKRIGRSVTLRPDWDVFRTTLMWKLVRQKALHIDILEKLLSTDGD